MKTLFTYTLAVAALLLHAPINAETFSYENEAQLVGAAIVSPESTRLILTKTLEFCKSNFNVTTSSANAAFSGWMKRHETYLVHSAGYRAAAKAMANDPATPEPRQAELRKLLEKDFPRLVNGELQAAILPLQIAKENGTGEAMCRNYIRALDDGKFDLKVKDPQLADFFNKRAPKN